MDHIISLQVLYHIIFYPAYISQIHRGKKGMKSIILIVADSLRYDTYKQVLEKINIPYHDFDGFNSCNSCTELSLPWMLSGMEIYSPNMNIPRDLEKKGYKTTLIHSNPIVHRFSGCFQETIDLAKKQKLYKFTKKYNRLRNFIEKHFPELYNNIKTHIRGTEETYLPYTRIYDTLPHITRDNPRFTWVHLMDPHTPYYPVETQLTYRETLDLNNHQMSAVRGYYQPKLCEVQSWYEEYKQECMESLSFLVDWLEIVNYDNTVIIFTSDHGEEFGEHGEYGHKGNRFNPENTRVPFVVIGHDLPECSFMDHSHLREYIKRLTK